MKRWSAKFIVLFIVAFLIGAAVVANNQGVPLLAGLMGEKQVQETQLTPGSNITASLPSATGNMEVADIVEQVSPAVVNIKAQVQVNSMPNNPFFNDPFFRHFFGDQYGGSVSPQYETGIGTGFIISADGYILTNQHVIENASSVSVQINGESKEIPAQIIGQDRDLDLAVLKIEGSGYQTLSLGDSDKMRVGEWVVAIGQPYGLDHTVTTGVVSAKGRPITIEDRNYKNLIQTDAAINPGNSGGPLLNLRGEVIGINTAVNSSAQGIGFAIPTNTVSEVLKDLISGNKIIRPYMGISMADIDSQVRYELQLDEQVEGVVIVEVSSGTAAAKAGLRYGDVITGIDGQDIDAAADVQELVSDHKVGDTITVDILRSGKHLKVEVTLEAKP